jgi:RNA polymerase sigma-70 factor (ECF subfamily)
MRKVCITNETECLLAFHDGHEAALTYIFKSYYPGLCYFSERITSSRSAAEDIVEEAFIKLWNKRSEFSSFPSIKAFLYVVIRNASNSYLKKQKKDDYHNKQFAYLSNATDDNLEIIRAEVITAVYNAIETLPRKCQQIFKMSYIEGFKNEQIADILRLSIQTVKNQKARAIHHLRIQLKGKEHLLNMAVTGIMLSIGQQ